MPTRALPFEALPAVRNTLDVHETMRFLEGWL